MRILSRTYHDSVINEIDANGHANTNSERGVEVTLHWRETDQAPVMAEVSSKTGDHHAEVGLKFEGLELVDYDGVFEMPSEVIDLLKKNGLDVSYVDEPSNFEDTATAKDQFKRHMAKGTVEEDN